MNPRKPTQDEQKQLREYLITQEGYGLGTVPEEKVAADLDAMIKETAIAVFDDYVTDSPGYAGKVMVAVWRGSPGMTQTFIWNNDTIELCPKEL